MANPEFFNKIDTSEAPAAMDGAAPKKRKDSLPMKKARARVSAAVGHIAGVFLFADSPNQVPDAGGPSPGRPQVASFATDAMTPTAQQIVASAFGLTGPCAPAQARTVR